MASRRPPTHRAAPLRTSAGLRRGAASLVVVMVLFFIVTLVAAYASRNLLFEQRTSTNQYRSTLAFEAAEAGVEWALARLNDARMNNNCQPLTSAASVTTQESFRDRYLGINGLTGAITPLTQPASVAVPPPERIAGCVFDGANWVCDCPVNGNPNPTVTLGTPPFAAFWVRFQTITSATPGVTGVVRMQVNACTRGDAACLGFNREAQPGDGLATIWTVLALRGGFTTMPASALTASGAIARTGGNPSASNPDSTSGGLTLHSGSTLPAVGDVTLATVAGTPPEFSRAENDPGLQFANLTLTPATPANTGTNRMFNSVFGMWPDTYFAQPGLVDVPCPSNCSATDINNAVLLNPGQIIRVRDGGTAGNRLRIDANIGTATAPVVIVADPGVNIELDSSAPTVHGVVYSRAANWQLERNGTIRGAAVAEQAFAFAGNNPAIVYDRDVLLRARFLNGSFVKVPGGWRDFQP